jgi:hypothetical protein
MQIVKSVEEIDPDDFERFPIWEYVNDDDIGETAVQPVEHIPTDSLSNRIIGTLVRLVNGSAFPALLGNIDVTDPRRTQHFLTLTIFKDGERFFLARYHDGDYDEHGPAALARFLELATDEVFPITYDIHGCCSRDSGSLAGVIEIRPREILTQSEIISLVVS